MATDKSKAKSEELNDGLNSELTGKLPENKKKKD